MSASAEQRETSITCEDKQAPRTSEEDLPSHNGRQCEADTLPVSGEVPVELCDSRVVPKPVFVEGEERACSKASRVMDSSDQGGRNVVLRKTCHAEPDASCFRQRT